MVHIIIAMVISVQSSISLLTQIKLFRAQKTVALLLAYQIEPGTNYNKRINGESLNTQYEGYPYIKQAYKTGDV